MTARSVKRSINLPPEMIEQLEKLAVTRGLTISELIREFIEKGLNVEGYTQEVDMLTQIIRQELTAIYRPEEVKAMMSQQVDRVAKMLMKLGKIDTGNYFLTLKLLLLLWGESEETMLELVKDTQELGIAYMQQNDGDINRFLENTENLIRITRRLQGGE